MSDIVLFHHVLGVTEGIEAFADRLRVHGHAVHTPSLFERRTFTGLEEGLAHAEEIGTEEMLRRADAALEELPRELVVGGFSLGVMAAQHIAQNRDRVRGAVLMHSFIAPEQVGGVWPVGLPAQVHGMDADPFFIGDGDLAAATETQILDPDLEIYLYPGRGHLFTDEGSPDHDAEATDLLLQRVLALLDRIDGGDGAGRH